MQTQWRWRLRLAGLAAALAFAPWAVAQDLLAQFQGMWSDPPVTAVGEFCMKWCTDNGIGQLNKLLDDPANDAVSFNELFARAAAYQQDIDIKPRLIGAAARSYPLDPLQDPSYLRCEPYGFLAQIVSRHQLEIRVLDKTRLELHYGEWDARRTVWLDGRKQPGGAPPANLGFSTGRLAGDALVIETTGIKAGRAFDALYSDQVRVVERYTRSADGKQLHLTITATDPQSYSQPVVVKKFWSWAPQATIAPYQSCQPPPAAATHDGRRS